MITMSTSMLLCMGTHCMRPLRVAVSPSLLLPIRSLLLLLLAALLLRELAAGMHTGVLKTGITLSIMQNNMCNRQLRAIGNAAGTPNTCILALISVRSVRPSTRSHQLIGGSDKLCKIC